MPGGSVNGRPLRESSDSYSRTGIACGNPKRFKSQDVVRMEPDKRTPSQPLAAPAEAIETEGQRQLQTLLQKQMHTEISLQEQLRNRKEFCKGVDFRSGTEELVGVVQLDEYKTQELSDIHLEDLRAYGLTNEEILFMLQHEQEEEQQMPKRSKLSNPEHDATRMQEIQDKIAQKQRDWQGTDSFSGVKQLSRHAMDVERTLSKAGNQSSFLHKVLIKEGDKPGTSGAADPMECLPEILKSVVSKKQRRKKRSAQYNSSCTLECCCVEETSGCDHGNHDDCDASCGTLSEVPTCMEKPTDYVSRLEPDTSNNKDSLKKEIPAKSTSFTVNMDQFKSTEEVSSDGGLRKIPYVEPVPEDAIQKYRYSDEEIRKIPRFEHYQPGEPTNVLYLKNLSAKVTEADLASLFVRYQKADEASIVYKLLTGRMKGQAFVTFPDVDTATKAMTLIHGYDFKGKPIIIQYGKKSTT